MPFFKDKDLLIPEINKISEDVFEKNNNQLLENKNNQQNENINIKQNVNNLNHNYYKFDQDRKSTFPIDEVEERSPSEEDFSSRKGTYERGKENININPNKISLLSKSPKNNNSLSNISYLKNNSLFQSKSPKTRKNYFSNKLNGFNELSHNYLQEVNPFYSKNETNISNKNFKSNTNL